MGAKKKIAVKAVCLTGICACALCIVLFYIYAGRLQEDMHTTPKQDDDGYYLLCTKEDFNWFISMAEQGNIDINVRLNNDLILNDTSGWENWDDLPPENKY